MTGFALESTEPLVLDLPEPLAGMYVLSPYVWHEGDACRMLLRLVNRAEQQEQKISRIHYGEGDGLRFRIDAQPAIAPGPGEDDRDGCEDPTVVRREGRYYVFYSGWNQAAGAGRLLWAGGEDPRHPEKRGRALAADPRVENPKEAAAIGLPDGSWRLTFEYAADGHSRIGLAGAPSLDGPWSYKDDLIIARAGRFDATQLSPGQFIDQGSEHPVLIYNGATGEDRWRIGWAAFDAELRRVVVRPDEPLFEPPPPEGDARDMAFAASAVERDDGTIWLYYTLGDQTPMRAVLRRR